MDDHIFLYFNVKNDNFKSLNSFSDFSKLNKNLILIGEYKFEKISKKKINLHKIYSKLRLKNKEILEYEYNQNNNLFLNEINISNFQNWDHIRIKTNKKSNIFRVNIKENFYNINYIELLTKIKTENSNIFMKKELSDKEYKRLYIHSKGKPNIKSIQFYKSIFVNLEKNVLENMINVEKINDKIEQEFINKTFININNILNNFNYDKINIKNKIATDGDYNLYYIYISKNPNKKNLSINIEDFENLIKKFHEKNFKIYEIGYYN